MIKSIPGNKTEEVGVVQGTVVGKDKFGEGGEVEVDKIPLLSAIVLVFLCPLFCLFFPSWLNSVVIVQALLVLWQLNWNGEGSLFIESSVYRLGQ